MGPLDLLPFETKGFPEHPHRGFVTVTYILEGKFEHKDSQGNTGKLEPGDVQWMTAGSGLVHSEMPEKEFAKNGGKLHGFQLWINLRKIDKWNKPDYHTNHKHTFKLYQIRRIGTNIWNYLLPSIDYCKKIDRITGSRSSISEKFLSMMFR